jgi:membrane fusion protein, multidrug efflux system
MNRENKNHKDTKITKKIKNLCALCVFVVFLVVLTGCSREKPSEKTPDAAPIVNAQIEVVGKTPVKEIYEATGTVRSKTAATLSSKVMGQVIALHVREGDLVRAGQRLVEIDDRDMTAQMRRAQAGFEEAQGGLAEIDQAIGAAQSARAAAEANRNLAASTYQRYQALLERQSISRQEFDEVEAKHKAAAAEADRADRMLQLTKAKKGQMQARIEQARADISLSQTYHGYATISSPIAGIVTTKNVEIGNMAVPGIPLLVVEDTGSYRLEALVDESRINLIRPGLEVSVLIDSLGDVSLTGRVGEVVPAADPASRSFTVKIDIPTNPSLRSGMFGRVRIPIGQTEKVTLPVSAVSERGQLTRVYVVDGTGKARLRLVKTGKLYGDRIEILSGLKIGERVLVGDTGLVSEGSRIE